MVLRLRAWTNKKALTKQGLKGHRVGALRRPFSFLGFVLTNAFYKLLVFGFTDVVGSSPLAHYGDELLEALRRGLLKNITSPQKDRGAVQVVVGSNRDMRCA